MRAVWWVVMVLGTGCVSSSAVPCGDHICPPDTTCHGETGLCIPRGCDGLEISGTEECDGAFLAGKDCTDYGFYTAGELRCSPVCTFDTTLCAGAGFCGDHEVNGTEYCDGEPDIDDACTDYGFDTGRTSCTSACSPGFDTCANVGWSVVGGDRLVPLSSVWGASATDVFAAGLGGRIWRGSGTTWTTMTTPTTTNLTAIWGTSATNVYAVGGAGTILRFDGTAWSAMTSPTTENLSAVWGRSASDIYAVGDASTIIHFDGASWSLDDPPLTGGPALMAVYGNADRVIAVGERGTGDPRMFRREGTSAWVTDAPPDLGFTYELNAIWATGDDFFAVGGESLNGRNVILRYNNGWTGQTTGIADLSAVWGTSASDVLAGGHTGVLWRFDGSAWRRVFVDASRAITGIWGTDGSTVFASTLGGTILAPDGFEWIGIDAGVPTIDFRGVWRYPDGEVIAVGQAGQVIEVIGASAAAAELSPAPSQVPVVQAIWDSGGAYGATTAVVTTTRGIYVRKPTESAFSLQALPGLAAATGNLEDAWGTSPTNIYAVGLTPIASSEQLILRYDGATWTKATVPTFASSVRLLAIWGSGPNDIFVVGNEGTILHSSDGQNFTAMTSGVTSLLRAVWGTGPDNVYAAGLAGVLLHYDGTSWRRVTLRSADAFTVVTGTSPHNVFVAGSGGFWHFDGTSWSKQALPIPFNVTGVGIAGDSMTFSGTLGGLLSFDHTCSQTETVCGDAWDNDCDGAINCADSDCAGAPACVSGGACSVETLELHCNESRRGTSFSGISRRDEWPCLTSSTTGSEITYRFVEPAGRQVTFSLSDVVGEPEIVVLESDNDDSACGVSTCTAGTGGSVTSTSSSKAIYVVVDSALGMGADFTISTSCD